MYITGVLLSDKVRYCERFLELVIDLEALLPTRRFFNTVMDDNHLVVRCQLSNLLHRPEGSLFGQVSLCKMLYLFRYRVHRIKVKSQAINSNSFISFMYKG